MGEFVAASDSTIASDGGARSCGGCAACCEGWLHDESMKLLVGSACPHIVPEGCGIYQERPEIPCRSFRCAWLDGVELFPDDLRPDRSGAIVIMDRDWFDWRVLRAFPVGGSVPDATLQRLVAFARPQQMPVIFYEHRFVDGRFAGTSEKALGPPKFAAEVRQRPSEGDTFRGMAG